MLYEFAITPDVFDPATLETDPSFGANLVYLFKELAFNGLVANLDKEGWEKHVASRSEQLPPALRDKFQAFLKLMRDRHRLVRHPKAPKPSPVTDTDWFQLAVHEHARFALHAAVVGPSLRIPRLKLSDPKVIRLPDLLNSPLMDARSPSVHIRQCAADFERVLAPVLRYARRVRLIDQHMDCTEARYKTTIDLCVDLIRKGPEGLSRLVEIHTGLRSKFAVNFSASADLDAWEDYLRPLVKPSGTNVEIHFTVFVWNDEPDGQRLHDRFIITDQCGISAPGGLDCQSKPTSTDWSLLSQEGVDQHIAEYDPVASSFTLLGSRKIP